MYVFLWFQIHLLKETLMHTVGNSGVVMALLMIIKVRIYYGMLQELKTSYKPTVLTQMWEVV